MLSMAGCNRSTPPDEILKPGPEASAPRKNTAPFFKSASFITVEEGVTTVTVVTAADAEEDTFTYALTGGEDAEWFDIDNQSGELRFKRPVYFDAPIDSNSDNIYIVKATVSDGLDATWQVIEVSVMDSAIDKPHDPPPSPPATLTRVEPNLACPERGFDEGFGLRCDHRIATLRYFAVAIRHAYEGNGFRAGELLKHAYAINDNGSIVGSAVDDEGNARAVKLEIYSSYPEENIYFTSLDSTGRGSEARGISNSYIAVGSVRHTNRMMPAVWGIQLGSPHVLDDYLGMKAGYAVAIATNGNQMEYVTGYVIKPEDGRELGFIWTYQGAGYTGSAVFGDEYDRTVPQAVNESGIIVGWVEKRDEGRQAFLRWGDLVRLVNNFGGESMALNINNNGSPIIVGTWWNQGGVKMAFSWHEDVMVLLPALAGARDSRAVSLTDGGDIVGQSDNRAVIWRDGRIWDLNSLLENPISSLLTVAIDVNRLGLILAEASDGNYYALIPKEARTPLPGGQ